MGIFQDIKISSFKEDDAIQIFRVLCTLPRSTDTPYISVSVSSNIVFQSSAVRSERSSQLC